MMSSWWARTVAFSRSENLRHLLPEGIVAGRSAARGRASPLRKVRVIGGSGAWVERRGMWDPLLLITRRAWWTGREHCAG